MPDPAPTPGLPNAVEAVRLVRSASGPVRGIVEAAGLLLAMPRDPHYRMSLACRAGVPLLTIAAVVNFVLWNFVLAIPFVAAVAERLILILLAMAAAAILAHELPRYRAVREYVNAYGAMWSGKT
jgi:hypothetical protein